MSVVEDAKVVVELGGGWLQRSVTALVAVNKSPAEFLRNLDTDHPDAMKNASLFAVFMNLCGLVVTLPVLRLMNVRADEGGFVVADTAITFCLWIADAFLFYVVARMWRIRQASFQRTFVMSLYLIGLLAPVYLLELPLLHFIGPLAVEGKLTASSAVSEGFDLWSFDSPPALVSAWLMVCYLVYALIRLVPAVRVMFRVSRWKALGIMATACLFYAGWNMWFELPLVQMVWQAFHLASK